MYKNQEQETFLSCVLQEIAAGSEAAGRGIRDVV